MRCDMLDEARERVSLMQTQNFYLIRLSRLSTFSDTTMTTINGTTEFCSTDLHCTTRLQISAEIALPMALSRHPQHEEAIAVRRHGQ